MVTKTPDNRPHDDDEAVHWRARVDRIPDRSAEATTDDETSDYRAAPLPIAQRVKVSARLRGEIPVTRIPDPAPDPTPGRAAMTDADLVNLQITLGVYADIEPSDDNIDIRGLMLDLQKAVAEIRRLREAVRGSLVIVESAQSEITRLRAVIAEREAEIDVLRTRLRLANNATAERDAEIGRLRAARDESFNMARNSGGEVYG